MRRLLLVMMCASGYLLTASGSAAQTGDAWIGTWTLNVAQSSFDPANLAPKSQTTKMTAAGGRVSAITDGVDGDGKKTHTEITYMFDGKDYDYKGAADPNSTRVYTRVDDHHYSYATKVNGAITTNARVAVTPDGKTRTVVTTGRDAQGRTIRNFTVWNRAG
ncbi:MAG TPA: hypothetical protein VKC35_09040 [Vicinamibacterales bacterium]|nr:hypothetical protein [Vicinamibacterales bacterium]